MEYLENLKYSDTGHEEAVKTLVFIPARRHKGFGNPVQSSFITVETQLIDTSTIIC